MAVIQCRSCWMGRNPTGAMNSIDIPADYFNFSFGKWQYVDAPDLCDSKHPGPRFWLCQDCKRGRLQHPADFHEVQRSSLRGHE